METTGGTDDVSPYQLLFKGLTLLPFSLYLLLAFPVFLIFLYNLLEFHIIHDMFNGFGGDCVSLTFDSSSDLYREVVSNCHLLHGRYSSTAWLSSPHLQTILLSFLVKTHDFIYKRELFTTSDGGTIALDWLINFNETRFQVNGAAKVVPIIILIPGLTSHSDTLYIKHVAYKMAERGWNVVVSNHRGLGGVPLTVKYLGEDGVKVPIIGAASICNPWDLLMDDRFLGRGFMQRFYNRVLANSLKDLARMHRVVYARVVDWEGMEKASSVGEINNYTSRIVGNFETVDAFHRSASSVYVVTNVKVPLVCINAMDDPVCTYEAIPFDECRMNKNIVLATTQHGGHIAFFEGLAGKNLW